MPNQDQAEQLLRHMIWPCTHRGWEHNCVPYRGWFGRRWLCVRCGNTFKTDTR